MLMNQRPIAAKATASAQTAPIWLPTFQPKKLNNKVYVGFTMNPNYFGPIPIFFQSLAGLREHIEFMRRIMAMNTEQLELYGLKENNASGFR